MQREAQAPGELRTLLGAVFTTGAPVLSGGPGAEPTFLGLPLEAGGERVGLVGLAQRPGGYDAGLIDFLQPFLDICGGLLAGGRHEQRRRQAEQEMRQTQEASAERVRLLAERLRLMMDSVQDGLWDLDMTTGRLFANRAWLGMLGYAEDELEKTQSTWASLCHPEDAAEAERLVQEHLEGALPLIENVQRLRNKDGGWTWVLTRARVVARDEQGRPLRMVGTNVNITTQKRIEERLRALIRTLPDLVLRQSADGTYLDYHAARPEDLAVPPEQLIGSNMRQAPFPAPLLDKMFMHLGRAIREGTLEVFDYALDMPEGGREYFEARIRRSGQDEAVSIIRNITERKQFEARLLQQEEELRRHRDSLEELVRNRSEKLLQATIELEEQQAQLIQAEKMASLGQMAAGVAHEINNPVSYVMSNLGTLDQYVSSLTPLLQLQRELLATPGGASTELLERMGELWKQEDMDFLLGDMPEIIEESLAGTRRIKEIAQSLRSFAREDTGEPQLVDVNTELASSLKIVWNELKYKCEVKRDFGPLPPVSCHPTQICQVFTNLLVKRVPRDRDAGGDPHPHPAGGQRGGGGDRRHRQGDDAGDDLQALHALLHHQAARPGHGAGAVRELRHHRQAQGPHRRAEPAGPGQHLHHPAARRAALRLSAATPPRSTAAAAARGTRGPPSGSPGAGCPRAPRRSAG